LPFQGAAFSVVYNLMRFIKGNYDAYFIIEPVEMQGTIEISIHLNPKALPLG